MKKNFENKLVVDIDDKMQKALVSQAKDLALTKTGYARMLLKKALEDQEK